MRYILLLLICFISIGNFAQEYDVTITEVHNYVGKEYP